MTEAASKFEFDATWDQFKAYVTGFVTQNRVLIHRGQSQAAWQLESTYHREIKKLGLVDPSIYWQLLANVHDYVGTYAAEKWNLDDPIDKASFLSYLQHHGFPTPLLDWTYSPYIAAYFAFEDVDDEEPKSDQVSIFFFDYLSWQSDWKQIYDPAVIVAHVSVLMTHARGNRQQILQQGAYTYSTVHDQLEHVRQHEQRYLTEHHQEKRYLYKVRISVKEKPMAMRELNIMGINAMTLFPDVSGVCRYLKHQYFAAAKVAATPDEKFQALLKTLNIEKLED